MKVSVITRHGVTNYGSLLQAMATQKAIEKLGYDCEIINYIREDETYKNQEMTSLKNKPNWYNNPLKRYLYLALRKPASVKAGKKFEKSRNKYLKMTKEYSNLEELVDDKPKADIYMTGSDQVWGPVSNGTYDSAYCLSFTNDEDKKVAYAASFGHTEMTDELKGYFSKWLTRYSHIAVREDSAKEFIDSIGVLNSQVLDPTFLLDKREWEVFKEDAILKKNKLKPGKYILIYQIHNDKKLGEYAGKVAKTLELPLVRISASSHQKFRNGKFIWASDLGEFLSLIDNAACIITDSFHGTAFALNFNTDFVEVLPNNNTGTRNMSILKLTGLTERILKSQEDVELAKQKIDFKKVNEILDVERKKSHEVLKSILQD